MRWPLSKIIHINYIYANKCKAHPKYQSSSEFYGLLGKTLLKYILAGYHVKQYEQVIVIFDKALPKKEQNQFLKTLKPQLKKLGKPYKIYFHQTLSDFNGQIADYAAWAQYVALERNEMRPLGTLSNIPKSAFDIFQNGAINYY
jgi:hypothetical protein